MKNYLALVLCAIALSGCTAHVGNQVLADVKHEDLKTKLIKGKTHKEDVRAMFGDPLNVYFVGEQEDWHYSLARADAKATNFIPYLGLVSSGHDTETKELQLRFDKDDILIKYSYSSSKGEVKSGLF